MKLIPSIFIFCLILMFSVSFIGCNKNSDDEEYAASQAKEAENEITQPQLIASTVKEEEVVDSHVNTTSSDAQPAPQKEVEKSSPTPIPKEIIKESPEGKTPAKDKPLTNQSKTLIREVIPATKDPKTQKVTAPLVKTTPATVKASAVAPAAVKMPAPVTKKEQPVASPISTPRGNTPPIKDVEASKSVPRAAGLSAKMDHYEYDFGNIQEGAKVVHTFALKNTGSEEIFIQDVDAGCNCTTTDYTFEGIQPGESTNIKVTFDSDTKVGTQMKNVIIQTNAGTMKVQMKGTVFPKGRNY